MKKKKLVDVAKAINKGKLITLNVYVMEKKNEQAST